MTVHTELSNSLEEMEELDWFTKESLMIRDFPQDERPRERFIHHGPQSLSNHELIAIMLQNRNKGRICPAISQSSSHSI